MAMRQGSSTVYYLLGDHLGSTSVTANNSGARVAELRYKPWGESRHITGTTPTRYQQTAVDAIVHGGSSPSQTRPVSPLPESAPPRGLSSTSPHAGRSRAAPASRACGCGLAIRCKTSPKC